MIHELLFEICFDVLFFGPGYLIGKYVLRLKDVKPDGFYAGSLGAIFWLVVLILLLAVFLG